MSTDYYEFQKPITAALVAKIGSLELQLRNISIWVDRRFSGSLLMSSEEADEFLGIIRGNDPIAHRHSSKAVGGLVMTIHKNLNPATCIISESGKILKFKDLEKEVII